MTAFRRALLVAALPGWLELSRRWWCAEQRSRLRRLGSSVAWLHDGEKIPWARWGAENGFFELEWADGLPYLRSVATAG